MVPVVLEPVLRAVFAVVRRVVFDCEPVELPRDVDEVLLRL